MQNLTFPTPLGVLSVEFDQNLRVSKLRVLSGHNQKIECYEQLEREITDLKNQIESYLRGDLFSIEYPVNLDFISKIDREVLRIVSSIPYGELWTYKSIANKLKISPRRVGLALSRNPAPIIIPCHRVIMANGKLGGYLFGVEIKRWLIEHERSILYKLQLHRI